VLDASREAPLVVIPSHKSHVDYLLLSYLFYVNGLVTPSIAAGNNLNFFPLGQMFRRWGAFFLRRSFKQNPLYARVFRAYMHKLLKDGRTVEFFIEGGRSRTGKLLPPKYGLLGHVVDAVVEGISRDVLLIPAAIGYEKIIEGRAYVRELSGHEKQGESIGGLLGATRVLSERFGRVYVSFDEPISLSEFLESQGVNADAGFRDAAHRRAVITKLGYRILGGINHVSPATASSIVATVLLSDEFRGISQSRLLARVGGLVDFLLLRRAPIADALKRALSVRRYDIERARDSEFDSDVLAVQALDGTTERSTIIGDALRHVVSEILDIYRSTGWVSVREFDSDEVYAIPDDARVQLDYYRSGLSHLLAADSILACAIIRCASTDDLNHAQLRSEAQFLSELLRLEFVFPPEHSFDGQYLQSIDIFQRAELIIADGDTGFEVSGRQASILSCLARTVDHFVEGYLLVAEGAVRLEAACEETEFTARLLRQGVRSWHEGAIQHREAVNTVILKNAVGWLIERGVLCREFQEQGRKSKRVLYLPDEREKRRELQALRERLKAYGGA
ncbi:MAG: 1-acyl-sn-glycerol-3-phosphate acyltransferase, partial [Myxococcota bacterium]|nr:1-acyl-sn-glycerol-3-phosphate acyltransferase [Myxococcota bacterium]